MLAIEQGLGHVENTGWRPRPRSEHRPEAYATLRTQAGRLGHVQNTGRRPRPRLNGVVELSCAEFSSMEEFRRVPDGSRSITTLVQVEQGCSTTTSIQGVAANAGCRDSHPTIRLAFNTPGDRHHRTGMQGSVSRFGESLASFQWSRTCHK